LIALNSFCPTDIDFVDADNYSNCNGCLETLREIMIPMEEMFIECKYKGQVINCKDHLQQVGLKQGLCYTFNGIDAFRTNIESQEVKQWTIDEGYAQSAALDAYPYRATGTGARFGLSILLRYKKTLLASFCERESGFWVGFEKFTVTRFYTPVLV
jgi:Amiloride-sensitive sodium channel